MPTFLPLALFPLALGTDPSAWTLQSPVFRDSAITFEEIPLQHLPKGVSGNFLFLSQSFLKEDAKSLRLSGGVLPEKARAKRLAEGQDELALSVEQWALCNTNCRVVLRTRIREQCQTRLPFVYLLNSEGRTAVFSNCFEPQVHLREVRFRLDTREVWSKRQRYTYKDQNHMMVKSYEVRAEESPHKSWVRWISNSEMLLNAKHKYFFPLSFNESDIQSEVLAYDQGPLGTLAKLSFFLEVLFFRIRLNLNSSVGYFSDEIRIPLILTVPLSGKNFKEDSGFFYGFQSPLVNSLAQIHTDLMKWKDRNTKVISRSEDRSLLLQDKGTCVRVHFSRPAGVGAAVAAPFPYLVDSQDLAQLGYAPRHSQFGVYFSLPQFEKGEYKLNLSFKVGNSEAQCRDLKQNATLAGDAQVLEVLQID